MYDSAVPDDYLEFVHRIDHSPLEANPALGAALEKLPGRKLILTNGTRKHADAVVQELEIHQHFEDVFDIVAAEPAQGQPLTGGVRAARIRAALQGRAGKRRPAFSHARPRGADQLGHRYRGA